MTKFPLAHRIERPATPYANSVSTDIAKTIRAARSRIAANGGQNVVERLRLVHSNQHRVETK